MRWIGISGSWRYDFPKIKEDVTREVEKILARGDGIVTGGAAGVDFWATEVVIRSNPQLDKLRIFLPTGLDDYTSHYKSASLDGRIEPEKAEKLIQQLEFIYLKRPKSIIQSMSETVPKRQTYFARNRQIAEACSELIGFQVNQSEGTGYTIDYAKKLGKKATVYSYKI